MASANACPFLHIGSMDFEIQVCPIHKDNYKWVSAALSSLARSSHIMNFEIQMCPIQ